MEMASFTYRVVSITIVLVSLTGFGSAFRIVSDPEPYIKGAEKVTISCLMDGLKDSSKSIMNMQLMNRHGVTIAVINSKQELKMGPGRKDNIKAEGHVDTVDASKSRLTLTIDKPGSQDAGFYRCRVFFTDGNFNIVEESVYGRVTYKDKIPPTTTTTTTTTFTSKRTGCPDGWTFYKGDKTCLKAFGNTLPWYEAEQACRGIGRDLVIIRDEDKSNFVIKMFDGTPNVPVWIGVKNYASRGFFIRYVDGSRLGGYHPWSGSNPDGDNDDGHKCVAMYTKKDVLGEWDDSPCYYKYRYVCYK